MYTKGSGRTRCCLGLSSGVDLLLYACFRTQAECGHLGTPPMLITLRSSNWCGEVCFKLCYAVSSPSYAHPVAATATRYLLLDYPTDLARRSMSACGTARRLQRAWRAAIIQKTVRSAAGTFGLIAAAAIPAQVKCFFAQVRSESPLPPALGSPLPHFAPGLRFTLSFVLCSVVT